MASPLVTCAHDTFEGDAIMGAIKDAVEKVRDALEPDTEDVTRYRHRCADCDATFITERPAEEATCEECGSSQVEEEITMHAGGDAGGGAG